VKYSIKEKSWKVMESLLMTPAIIAVSIGIVQIVKWVETIHIALAIVVLGSVVGSMLYVSSLIIEE